MNDIEQSAKINHCIVVVSGASGGHLFPAVAVAKLLAERGYDIRVVLGSKKFSDVVTDAKLPLYSLPSAAFNDRKILAKIIAFSTFLQGFFIAWQLLGKFKPSVVFGTGGYATVAMVFAAWIRGIPVVIHEQNVLPGRANRLLARFADVLLLTFEKTRSYFPGLRAQIYLAGTPLRAEILAAARQHTAVSKKKAADGSFSILILGGSQGAHILSRVVPEAIRLLSSEDRSKLTVVQQARGEDIAHIQHIYASLGLAKYEVSPFFKDMPQCYRNADVVIGRSGVGTLLESAVFGIPAIYVPLELADGHQTLNAEVAEEAGAAKILPQKLFTPANLLAHILAIWHNPDQWRMMSVAALTLARVDATKHVVNIVEDIIKTRS